MRPCCIFPAEWHRQVCSMPLSHACSVSLPRAFSVPISPHILYNYSTLLPQAFAGPSPNVGAGCLWQPRAHEADEGSGAGGPGMGADRSAGAQGAWLDVEGLVRAVGCCEEDEVEVVGLLRADATLQVRSVLPCSVLSVAALHRAVRCRVLPCSVPSVAAVLSVSALLRAVRAVGLLRADVRLQMLLARSGSWAPLLAPTLHAPVHLAAALAAMATAASPFDLFVAR